VAPDVGSEVQPDSANDLVFDHNREVVWDAFGEVVRDPSSGVVQRVRMREGVLEVAPDTPVVRVLCETRFVTWAEFSHDAAGQHDLHRQSA
jgi:hypothetical protein